MGEIIGSFDSLTEAQKLTQSVLLAGVLETMIKEGALLPKLPIHRVMGLSLTYNREVFAVPTGLFKEPTSERVWVEDITYTQVTEELEYFDRNRVINRYMARNWANINDFEATVMKQMVKEITYFLEDRLIYANHTTDSKEPDGLHVLANATAAQHIHQGGASAGAALSIMNLRKLVDLVKPRPDLLLMNYNIWRRISAALQEAGTASFAGMGQFSWDKNEMGARVLFFDGVPILATDWITQEETVSSYAYGAKTGGAATSIFAIRKGLLTDGGFCILVGAESAGGELWEVKRIEELESHYGTGLMFRGSLCPALGSVKALAMIDGITDVAVVA